MNRLTKILVFVGVFVVVVAMVVTGLSVMQNQNSRPEGGQTDLADLPTTKPPATDQSTDPKFAKFYDQKLDWAPCLSDAECSSYEVPLDWNKPDGKTLRIAVSKVKATGTKKGSLLMNPGGPGSSGVNYVGRYAPYVASQKVRKQFDLIGFDPRGAGRSQPIDCLSDPELDNYMSEDNNPETDEGLEKQRQSAKRFIAGCVEKTGDLLPHVGTPNAARDMDVLRGILGENHMDYLGKSYGTLLGAMYAELFPHRVGRFVLDGAVDPQLTTHTMVIGQAKGMEQALRSFLGWCVKRSSCPYSGDDVEVAVKKVKALLDQLDEKPMPVSSDSRDLTVGLGGTGIVSAMYSTQSWPALEAALNLTKDNEGQGLLKLADQYSDRQPDGSYGSNLMEAFSAINCTDYPAVDDTQKMRANAEELKKIAPVFGPFVSYSELLCGNWPNPDRPKLPPMNAEGAAPILVIGTTRDPATPYAWSEAMASQLKSAHLLSFDGDGHTAYMSSSPNRGALQCVNRAVDDYLLGVKIPNKGAKCA